MRYMPSYFFGVNVRRPSLILFLIAIIPPLLSLFLSNPPLPRDSDQFDFHQMAVGFLEGKGLSSNARVADVVAMPNVRHPLYPLFIALLYSFTSESAIAVQLVQIAMHGVTCIVIFLISKQLFKDGFISFGAALLWALYPLAVFHSITLLSETLFTFLLAASVYFLLQAAETPQAKNIIFSGFLLGLTALTKSIIFAFLPAFFLWLVLCSDKKLMLKLKSFCLIVLCMFVTISPWLLRNYFVIKQFFPLASGNGLSFYRYNNEKTQELMYTPQREAFPFTEAQKQVMKAMSEQEADQYLYALGRQFIRSHPGDFFAIRFNELCAFWHLWPTSPQRFTNYYNQQKQEGHLGHNVFLERFLDYFKSSYFLYVCKILYHMPYNILFLGMLAGFIIAFKREREQWKKVLLLYLLIATVNAVYIFHHGADRYRLPIDPYVFMAGLYGLYLLHDNLKTNK